MIYEGVVTVKKKKCRDSLFKGGWEEGKQTQTLLKKVNKQYHNEI